MPFEKNKNARELGIDTTRKFRVVEDGAMFDAGEIIVLIADDNSEYPYFRSKNNSHEGCCYWDRLEYADVETKDVETKTEECKFKVGDKVRCKPVMTKNSAGWAPGYEFIIDRIIKLTFGDGIFPKDGYGVYSEDLELVKEPVKNNNIINSDNSNKSVATKFMEKVDDILTFVKDLHTSEDDKELRKAGLKNKELQWTSEAIEIVRQKEAKSLGYKDFEDLRLKNGCDGDISTFEVATLIAKYYTELLALAKKFNARNDNKD